MRPPPQPSPVDGGGTVAGRSISQSLCVLETIPNSQGGRPGDVQCLDLHHPILHPKALQWSKPTEKPLTYQKSRITRI